MKSLLQLQRGIIWFCRSKMLALNIVAAVNVHFIVIGTCLTMFSHKIYCLNHFQPQLLPIHSRSLLKLRKFIVIGLGIVSNGPASSLTCRTASFLIHNTSLGQLQPKSLQRSVAIATRRRNQFSTCFWNPHTPETCSCTLFRNNCCN